MSTVEQHEVDTALGRVRIRSSGSGEVLLFWPSLLMTGDMWSAQARHFAGRNRVLLVDPPGHGASEKVTAPFTFDQCAQCVVDILDGLGLERVHFVGNSWGGMIGGTFAARHPDRVGRAVLMNCTAAAAGLRQKIEFGLLVRAATALGGVRPPVTRSVLKAFLGPTTFRTRPEVVAYVRASVEAVDVRSARWAVRSIVARPDQHELFSTVRTPVLVVAGAEDATFPLPEPIDMAAAIPGAAVAVMEGVAHLAALENPSVTNRLIEQFVFAT